MTKTIYLPGLNGIRAIASIAVVISHTILNLESFGLKANFLGNQADGTPQTLNLASYGVTMFFALSGFLITFLLCKEKEANSINIKKFYLRRILRIWPLYYAYFFSCILICILFEIQFDIGSIVYYLFYSANVPFIIGGTLPFLVHFWSLGVEEQFYIFWPWVNKLSNKVVFKLLLLLITLILVVKTYLHLFIPNTILETIIHVSRFHCMMLGGLSAILYYQNNLVFLRICTHKITQLICWLIFFLVAINKYHIASFLDNEILAVVTCLIILGQITRKGIVSLENKYFDFLGKISYGIYVIHPLVIYFYSKILTDISSPELLNYLIVFVCVIGTTIYISYLSFIYFESRFIKLKEKKYTVIKSSNISK